MAIRQSKSNVVYTQITAKKEKNLLSPKETKHIQLR